MAENPDEYQLTGNGLGSENKSGAGKQKKTKPMDANESVPTPVFVKIIFGALVLIGLFLTNQYSYLLFHSLVKIFSISIAFGIFIFAFNTRWFQENDDLLASTAIFYAKNTLHHCTVNLSWHPIGLYI